MSEVKTKSFEAEVSQVLSLVINSLYSNKEIFVRELVSNASDALDKLKFEALTNPSLITNDTPLTIRVTCDPEENTITIWDNGIGMTEEELSKHLGTVAHSGSKAFLEALKAQADSKADDLNIIGQFGVGFYSSYLVADHVDVVSRKAGTETAYKWSSDGKSTYTIEPSERDTQGTTITLHIKEEEDEFLQTYRLRSIVKQYSDFIGYPIEMLKNVYPEDTDEDKSEEELEGEEGEKKEPELKLPKKVFEQVNQAEALWQRRSDDLTKEQYEEFYKHLTSDWEPPLAYTLFKIEGVREFTGLLYIPKRPPFDLFNPEATHGVRLFVKKVFIMDDADALLPKWLRFVRGVVDSADLPLNVSRELLQDSKVVRSMKKQIIKKVLELLDEVAANRPEDYKTLWDAYGAVIKEGLHFDPNQSDKLAEIIRFVSSKSEFTSLKEYIERMPEGQESIYYALGQSKALLDSSPHLEALKKRNYEVLYLTDSVDQWAIANLQTYNEKSLVDATSGELNLEETEEDEKKEETQTDFSALISRFQTVLGDDISEVRVSKRLADSPACLVVPEGGMAAHIERMIRAQNQALPSQKRILELNPTHTLVMAVNQLEQAKSPQVDNWIHLIYDQALIAEGTPIKDPGSFSHRLTTLMNEVASTQVQTTVPAEVTD